MYIFYIHRAYLLIAMLSVAMPIFKPQFSSPLEFTPNPMLDQQHGGSLSITRCLSRPFSRVNTLACPMVPP